MFITCHLTSGGRLTTCPEGMHFPVRAETDNALVLRAYCKCHVAYVRDTAFVSAGTVNVAVASAH